MHLDLNLIPPVIGFFLVILQRINPSLEESIPIECQPSTCQPWVLHNEQVCLGKGEGGSLNSEGQAQHVLGEGYGKIQCIKGNGYMGSPLWTDKQTWLKILLSHKIHRWAVIKIWNNMLAKILAYFKFNCSKSDFFLTQIPKLANPH